MSKASVIAMADEAVLLVQLSDMHIRAEASGALKRIACLPGAIGSLRGSAGHVVFLLTGDIAFSGRQAEYKLAEAALRDVASRLISEWRFNDVTFFACPGNHDCDFSAQRPAVRDALLSSITSEGNQQIDLIRELSEVQRHFDDFARSISPAPRAEHGVVRSYELTVGGRTLNVHTVNTSWSSRLNEVPGSLRLPAQVLPTIQSSEALAFALLHHPMNWYDPQDGKAVSDWLDANTDVAMWGHEHREDVFKIVRRRFGSTVQHFIAQPIDDDTVECGFRALELRRDNACAETRFRWRGDRFEADNPIEMALKKNPARQLGQIRFAAGFRSFLTDPGGSFKHPRLQRSLMLQDIFIEPTFRSYVVNSSENEKLEGSLSLAQMCDSLAHHASTMVFGPEQAGKTTFAKYLLEDARHQGLTPLYFDGARLRSALKGEVTSWINSALEFQYEDDCVDLVKQSTPASRLVVIDNVHEIPGSTSAVREILERVRMMGQRVVYLSAQNPAVTILAAGYASGEEVKLWADVKWYEVLPLNNRARGNLIRRWVATGRDETFDRTLIESEVRRIKALLDGGVGRGLSVKYPFFLLALLQQIDAGLDASTVIRNGSHGHIFEAMVTTSLDLSVRSHDLGVTHDFLASLAFQLWSSSTNQVSESGLEALISDFRRDRLVQLAHPGLINELVSSKVLQKNTAGFSFRYEYFYYYYLARWISHGRGDEASSRLLQSFIENIHTELSSNVVIFVAHMGHEAWVLDLLMPAASSLFKDDVQCKLADQAALVARYAADGARRVIILSGEDDEVSDHHHQAQDELGDRPEENLEDAFKYMTAIRIIQVLGQVMRSRAGSISAARKKQITREAMALARRLMSVLYEAAELSAEAIIEHASELFDTDIKRDSVEARGFANQFISAVVGGVSKGLVSRAAEVFATRDLVPLIDTLEAEALESHDLDDELIVLCARVIAEQRYPREKVESFLKKLPDSDILSRSALAFSVARTFYLQPPPRAVRDAACNRLGISVTSVPARKAMSSH